VTEFLDQRVVVIAAQARLLQAEVERILAQLGVVGADVEHDGQAQVRMHARACGIEGKLAHRNAHPVRAQVAQSEDALAVGDNDDRDIAPWPVGEHLRNAPAVARADEDAARPLKDVTVLLAGEPNGRRVDDREHLVGVVDQQPEEQRFVAIVQRRQVDVLFETGRLAPEILEHSTELLVL
jgi:hypothetical protein